jgi:putative ABC transport system ATP-binding protein
MSAQKVLVSLHDLSKHYGEGVTRVDALKSINLELRAGEVVGVLGPSGCGKSTLLNVVGAIVEPSSGQITLGSDLVYDDRWLRHDLRRLRLDKIGFIFQFHNLIPFLSVLDNVQLVLQLAGRPAAEARSRAIELLDYLQIGDRRNAMPAQLSGGQAQRVAIARALANRPSIILADEPTAALDTERAGIVMDLLRQVATERNATILVVSHDEKIFGRFDRIVEMRDGSIVEQRSRMEAMAS